MAAGFDRVARAYRWMEYLTLGTALERTRGWALNAGWMDGARRALVLGDGDGRFTARLLRRNPQVEVEAVDLSAGMLRLLGRRCGFAGDRLRTRQEDAREFVPEPGADLVATHFFLDCLTGPEARELVARVSAGLAQDALWAVSEFRIPAGWMRWPAWALVRGLYLAFRVLTGLRVTRLPDYAAALEACGFELAAERRFLGGLLVAQVFRKARASNRGPS
jgi:SAM-dependent methyltransferase